MPSNQSRKATVRIDPATVHHCDGYLDGDCAVFNCAYCNFKRTMNLKTGKMRTTGGDAHTQHIGFVAAAQVTKKDLNPN